ncbi:Uncharacterised protein [Bordetella ansorpii]|uniref:Uncharacterized protein n=1 Tax=Bordetella ansorpii TaxID=288768 RepID=A0A157SHK1_9BORD|nr:hypothetical protein [Bordetella ansorpii]SAI69396.1 Uncharacterised protein [Bordetella ansorpii]
MRRLPAVPAIIPALRALPAAARRPAFDDACRTGISEPAQRMAR